MTTEAITIIKKGKKKPSFRKLWNMVWNLSDEELKNFVPPPELKEFFAVQGNNPLAIKGYFHGMMLRERHERRKSKRQKQINGN